MSFKKSGKDIKRITIIHYSSPLLSSPLRNYGGVYVGLPADLTTVAASQSKSTRKGNISLTL
uniref:Uncharacterized protein n=1 Tax=Seriola dumerili TaxID=41447 RepID=A0A3B4VNK9_SERDU